MNEMEWHLLEDRALLSHVNVDGVEFTSGDHIRVRPRSGGDIMDVALAAQNRHHRKHRAGLRRRSTDCHRHG